MSVGEPQIHQTKVVGQSLLLFVQAWFPILTAAAGGIWALYIFEDGAAKDRAAEVEKRRDAVQVELRQDQAPFLAIRSKALLDLITQAGQAEAMSLDPRSRPADYVQSMVSDLALQKLNLDATLSAGKLDELIINLAADLTATIPAGVEIPPERLVQIDRGRVRKDAEALAAAVREVIATSFGSF